MPRPRKPRRNCLNCGRETKRPVLIYCDARCHKEHQHEQYIERWLRGEELGYRKNGQVSKHVQRYLREKHDNRCQKCGWNETNPTTGKVPLETNHIDGDWQNTVESNLELLCPNCHSLTPNYKVLNKGRGRKFRAPVA